MSDNILDGRYRVPAIVLEGSEQTEATESSGKVEVHAVVTLRED